MFILGCVAFSAPGYEGPVSDHFDGERFYNLGGSLAREPGGLLKWMLTRKKASWPDWNGAKVGPAPPREVRGGGLRVTFVNHATVLIQMDGVNVLTDPMYSRRASPVSWAGPRRRRPPGIAFEDLPPIHAVVVSHNHYDHLDLPTLERLARAHRPRIFAGLGNGGLLAAAGIPGFEELDWWQRVPLAPGIFVSFVPAQHFSARGICDRNRTLWGGYVIEGPSGAAYFAGDTGLGPHFAEIAGRFPAPRLAVLPIGAFLPRWFMKPMHVSPAEAVEAARILGARYAMPMHYGTFPLADDGHLESLEELRKALAAAGPRAPLFRVLEEGEGWDVPRAPPPPK